MRGKILFEPVRNDNRRAASPVPGLLVPPNRSNAVDAHETGNAMFATAFSLFPEIPMDPRAPVNTVTGQVGRPNLLQDLLVLLRPPRLRCLPPCVQSTPMHPHDPGHRRQAKLATMRHHKRVPHPDALAKYAAAFFRMSLSSSTRFSSDFRRAFSARRSSCTTRRGVLPASLSHLYSEWGLTPRRPATSRTGYPRSVTCRTASARNSIVYRLLDIDTSLDPQNCPKRCLQIQGKSTAVPYILGIFKNISDTFREIFNRPRELGKRKINGKF